MSRIESLMLHANSFKRPFSMLIIRPADSTNILLAPSKVIDTLSLEHYQICKLDGTFKNRLSSGAYLEVIHHTNGGNTPLVKNISLQKAIHHG